MIVSALQYIINTIFASPTVVLAFTFTSSYNALIYARIVI